MCNRKWQVCRNRQRLNIEAIRWGGWMQHLACLSYRHGSMELHGRAAGRQHLAWFKVLLNTTCMEIIFYQLLNMSGKTMTHFNNPSFCKEGSIDKELDLFQNYAIISLLLWYQILYLTGTLGALLPWRRTVSNVRHGTFRKGMVTLETATWVSWNL